MVGQGPCAGVRRQRPQRARHAFRGFPDAVTLNNPSWLLIFGAEPPAGQFWTSDLAAMSAADMWIAAESVRRVLSDLQPPHRP